MTKRFPIERLRGDVLQPGEDELSIEEPLLVRLNGQVLATLMRTPGRDRELVEGFLFSEGLLRDSSDVSGYEWGEAQEVSVTLAPHCRPGPTAARSIYLSSSCGVCGRASIGELLERLEPIEAMAVEAELLLRLPEALRQGQRQFPLTGGVHAAALFDGDGKLLEIEEDIGRHNALDKVIGKCLREKRLPLAGTILVMSSRASFDIVQKAAMAGIPVIATMGAASSLAAELAARAGVQLFCFLRPNSVVRMGNSELGSYA